ncbi:hypothetical protein HPB51_015037 [Rhipicephalus microplus]|uniref:CS domain-containing protein n=1 Tax=Rhipicephalus microplus TaxID=6941 RepID=A0A9J6ESX0_RHIMP|nr:hypothetical protein HPB51_015037 [Rhipicephalus microplus]
MDASRRGIYDAALMGILSNEGQIYPFLDAIFDFLYRRTDFYHIKSSPSDKLGFNPGVARRIVRAAFESYHKLADEAQKKKDAAARVVTQTDEPVPIAAEVEVETTTSDDMIESTTSESVAAEPVETVPAAAKSKSQCSQKGDADNVEATKDDKADGPTVSAPKAGDENDDRDYDPVQAKFQSHPESYNGAMRDNYCWSQSIHDIDVRVKVAPDVTSRNQVRVTIGTNHLKVELLDLTTKTWSVHVDDDLHFRIKLDESIWTLVPGDHVLINLEKATELWWERLLVNEPKINIRAIDPTKPFEDLDPESQAKIQEITYNNLLKQAGRKTPQEEVRR